MKEKKWKKRCRNVGVGGGSKGGGGGGRLKVQDMIVRLQLNSDWLVLSPTLRLPPANQRGSAPPSC